MTIEIIEYLLGEKTLYDLIHLLQFWKLPMCIVKHKKHLPLPFPLKELCNILTKANWKIFVIFSKSSLTVFFGKGLLSINSKELNSISLFNLYSFIILILIYFVTTKNSSEFLHAQPRFLPTFPNS